MDALITLHSQQFSAQEFCDLLSSELADAQDISLEVKRFRSPETAVLVAIVGAAGTGLGALITGLLRLAIQKKSNTVVIQGRHGRRIEVPVNCPSNKLEEYVKLAKDFDIDRIEL
jgi:hypothetical protein